MKSFIASLCALLPFTLAAQTPNNPAPIPPSTSHPAGADGNVNWFQRLDTNSDGNITREEFSRFSALNGTSQSNANINGSTTTTTGTGNAGSFQTLDANADGMISREEFAHFSTLNGTSQPGTSPDGASKTSGSKDQKAADPSPINPEAKGSPSPQ